MFKKHLLQTDSLWIKKSGPWAVWLLINTHKWSSTIQVAWSRFIIYLFMYFLSKENSTSCRITLFYWYSDTKCNTIFSQRTAKFVVSEHILFIHAPSEISFGTAKYFWVRGWVDNKNVGCSHKFMSFLKSHQLVKSGFLWEPYLWIMEAKVRCKVDKVSKLQRLL